VRFGAADIEEVASAASDRLNNDLFIFLRPIETTVWLAGSS